MTTRAAVLLLAVAFPPWAWGCGVCVEDKMAATYDHAVVEHALAQRRVVVFCEIQGVVHARRLRDAAARIAGIDPRSVRTSAAPAAMSFAVDPRVLSAQAAVAQIQVSVGPTLRLSVLKTLPATP